MGCGSPGPRAQARVQQLRVPPATIVGVGDRQHIVGAFAAGCDEYLASPLCLQELAVRLARQSPEGPPPAAGAEEPLSLDGRRAELVVRGRRLRLRPSELRLLEYLGRAADRTVTAAEIVEHVLGTHGNGGSARTLIWNLRRRMQKASCDDPGQRAGHGYRLADGARWSTERRRPAPPNTRPRRRCARADRTAERPGVRRPDSQRQGFMQMSVVAEAPNCSPMSSTHSRPGIQSPSSSQSPPPCPQGQASLQNVSVYIVPTQAAGNANVGDRLHAERRPEVGGAYEAGRRLAVGVAVAAAMTTRARRRAERRRSGRAAVAGRRHANVRDREHLEHRAVVRRANEPVLTLRGPVAVAAAITTRATPAVGPTRWSAAQLDETQTSVWKWVPNAAPTSVSHTFPSSTRCCRHSRSHRRHRDRRAVQKLSAPRRKPSAAGRQSRARPGAERRPPARRSRRCAGGGRRDRLLITHDHGATDVETWPA